MLKSTFRLIVYGFMIWLVPFVIGMAIFGYISPETALFDTLMSISLAAAVTIFGIRYMSNQKTVGLAVGLQSGLVWMAVALVLDIPLFLLGGPMKMTPYDYFTDIGLTYVMIPIISTGMAYTMNKSA